VTPSVLMMTAGCWQELSIHGRAAITNGLTREEIREVILQVGLYRGAQIAIHGNALLREAQRDS
jgi:4-carboxymuconolactone decarboxylase